MHNITINRIRSRWAGVFYCLSEKECSYIHKSIVGKGTPNNHVDMRDISFTVSRSYA